MVLYREDDYQVYAGGSSEKEGNDFQQNGRLRTRAACHCGKQNCRRGPCLLLILCTGCCCTAGVKSGASAEYQLDPCSHVPGRSITCCDKVSSILHLLRPFFSPLRPDTAKYLSKGLRKTPCATHASNSDSPDREELDSARDMLIRQAIYQVRHTICRAGGASIWHHQQASTCS